MGLLCPPKAVGDDTAKFLIRDPGGRPTAVLLGSPPDYPDAVHRSMSRARAARSALGPELGRVVLDPLVEGRASGLSYAVLPYCAPWSENRLVGRIQRLALGPSLFGWLRRATRATLSEPFPGGSDPELVGWLEYLAGLREVSGQVRGAAEQALGRLSSGAWRPRRVLLHGDLWTGNLLFRQPHPGASATAGDPLRGRLVIIDWDGSRPDGCGIFDLLRLAASLRSGPRRLRREVAAHCEALGCDLADARSYLALALGELGLRLEQFPMHQFAAMADSLFNDLRAIGA
jgi:hypothetical protein